MEQQTSETIYFYLVICCHRAWGHRIWIWTVEATLRQLDDLKIREIGVLTGGPQVFHQCYLPFKNGDLVYGKKRGTNAGSHIKSKHHETYIESILKLRNYVRFNPFQMFQNVKAALWKRNKASTFCP